MIQLRFKTRSRLRHNVLANLVGRGWVAVIGMVCIPVYIALIGIESWALIGLFATLQAILGLLDLGLSTSLNRELARLSACNDTAREQGDLVRTLETVYWGTAVLLGSLVLAAAPLVGRYWISSDELPVETVDSAVRMMGLIFVFRFPFALYQGGLMGLQRQVLMNGILGGMGTIRSVGAVAVLWWIAPTIQAFFIWQLMVSILQTFVTRSRLLSSLPRTDSRPRFEGVLLLRIWRFAAGMTLISATSIVLLNQDKIVLTKMLTLEAFGYYMLAAAAAGVVPIVVSPIHTSIFPKFSQIVGGGDQLALTQLYHRACQIVSILTVPLVALMFLFSRELLTLWTRNPELVDNAHLILSLLVLGSGFNALMSVPYALQLANGWTRLTLYQNVVSAMILVPALIVSVQYWGGVGAAGVWVVLNAAYVMVMPQIMHRRLLKGEKGRWYREDIGRPILAVVLIVCGSRWLVPFAGLGAVLQPLALCMTWVLATAAAVAASPLVHEMIPDWTTPLRLSKPT